MVGLTVVVFVALPVWLIGATLVAPFLPGRWRPLRVLWLVLVHLVLETYVLVRLFFLWILSGFGRHTRGPTFERAHYDLVERYLAIMLGEAERVLHLRVEIDGPGPAAYDGRPLLVFARHAGPGDSFLLVHFLVNAYDREPRIVLKDTLQWDPAIDVLLNRLPNRFIRPGAEGLEEQIGALARGLDDNDAFVIFPEGGNFTERRRARAIARLQERGRLDDAEKAARMRNVLAGPTFRRRPRGPGECHRCRRGVGRAQRAGAPHLRRRHLARAAHGLGREDALVAGRRHGGADRSPGANRLALSVVGRDRCLDRGAACGGRRRAGSVIARSNLTWPGSVMVLRSRSLSGSKPLMEAQVPARTARLGLVVTLAALSLAGIASSPAQAARPGDGDRFDTWVGYDVGRAPTAVAAGDFNADGAVDVAWARDAFADFGDPDFTNSVEVSMNLGEGSLDQARGFPAVEQSTDIATADLDGDDDLDLAVSARDSSSVGDRVDLYLNDGTGDFTHSTAVGGEGPESIELGDLDGDGDVDIVLPNYWAYDEEDPEAGTVSVLLNNGDATFAPEVRYQVGWRQQDVRVGDVDGDGLVDLVAIREASDGLGDPEVAVLVLSGNGDGTFTEDADPQIIVLPGDCCPGTPTFQLGDLDGDGDLDAATGAISYGHNAVFLNDGSGVFEVAIYDLFGSQAVRLADLDDDDDLDLASVGGGGGVAGSAYVQRNNGDGTLGEPEEIRTSNNPLGLDVADIDGDGRPDLAVASRDTGTGVVHRQHDDGTFAAPPSGTLFAPSVDVAPGDVDGDGDVDVAATGVEDSVDVIRILDNDGTGDLSQTSIVRYEDAGSRLTRSVSLDDLDGDDDVDLSWLVNQYSFFRIVTALNNGDGTFAEPTARAVAVCGTNLTVGDADGDGDLDEVVGNDGGCGASELGAAALVSYNNGDGTFTDGPLVDLTYRVTSVVVTDVNGDAIADLVGGGAGQGGLADIAVALGEGDGTFGRPSPTSTGTQHREMVAIDFEGDGVIDIASNTYDEGTVLLRNDGSGDFTVDNLGGEAVSGYRNAVGIAAGDINGDAIMDIVVANETGNNVGVHAGLGDGGFEERQVRYGMRPRVTDVELADLTGDGLLDVISPAQLPGGGIAGETDAGAQPDFDAAAPDVSGGDKAGGVTVLLNRRPKCTITGTSGPDELAGTRGADVICGLGGDDIIRGRGGGDILLGGGGNDQVKGGSGLDVVDGGGGDDTLSGGTAVDRLRGGNGADTVKGNAGRDVVDGLDGVGANDVVSGGSARDHCRGDQGDQLTSCP